MDEFVIYEKRKGENRRKEKEMKGYRLGEGVMKAWKTIEVKIDAREEGFGDEFVIYEKRMG